MNPAQHLLTCLAEECAEVAERICLGMERGFSSAPEGGLHTIAHHAAFELCDLMAVREMLHDAVLFPCASEDPLRVEQAKAAARLNPSTLASTLAVECLKVAQLVSKALRFGLHEVEMSQRYTNADRISQGLCTVIGLTELAKEARLLPAVGSLELIAEKKAKVRKFMDYAAYTGALTVAEREHHFLESPARDQ